MKKYLVLFSLLLSACSSLQPQPLQLATPEYITHDNKRYQFGKSYDLGDVVRYVYWQPKQNSQNWQSAVELFLDRNKQHLSLSERLALRNKVYGAQPVGLRDYHLDIKDDYLYGYVIYEPTQLNKGWQVDVLKGKDVKHCGFVQYQYSVKVGRSGKIRQMSPDKLVGYLKKYVADKELNKLKQASWQWQCAKPNRNSLKKSLKG